MSTPNPKPSEEPEEEHRALDPLVERRDHANQWDVSALWHDAPNRSNTPGTLVQPDQPDAE